MKLLVRYAMVLCGALMFSAAMAGNKAMEQADRAFESGTYYKAISLYKKAYVQERDMAEKARIIYQIATCYRMTADAANAELWYDKAIKAKYYDADAWYYMAKMQQQQGAYVDAIQAYKRYATESGKAAEVENAIKACEAAQMWLENPEPYEVVAEPLLNSRQYDFSPTFSDARENAVIFASGRDASTGEETDGITGEDFQDLYLSERDRKGKWSEPRLLEGDVNTEANEGAACLNNRKNKLFFTRCVREKNQNLGCEIMVAQRQGQNWRNVQRIPLKPEGADSISVGHPALTPDDEVLIFAGNLPGGYGGNDLWYSTYDKKADQWSAPANLGPHINTAGNEMFPFVHADGSLYFASDGHPGMGGLDMFVARANGFAEWVQPENLKYPLNSNAHDFGIIIEKETERGYFSSNRRGTGQDDIFSFRKLEPVFKLTCIVRDVETGKPVPGVSITLKGTDATHYALETDENGEVYFDETPVDSRYLNAHTGYDVKGEKADYFVVTDAVSTEGLEQSTHFVKELYIQNVVTKTTEGLEMPEVRYAYREWKLLVEEGEINSFDSLNYLYDIMMANPTFVIELHSHTDTRGSATYNRRLSQKRAQSCVDYLVSKGIHPQRLIPVGDGEDVPRITDAQIAAMPTEEEQSAAHQTNRRTTFKVRSTDFMAPPEK